MDAVYEALDEAKSEIVNLKDQYRVKSELAESLKRAHNDQLIKSKETSSKLEKLSQELNQKNDEIYNASQIHESLKSKLAEKESIIKHISSSHDTLRSDYSQNLKKLEEENISLAAVLDEATAHSRDQEQKICSLKQEIEGVKRHLAFPEKKCSEKESKNNFEAREHEYFKLDDEKTKLEDQLKWKKEQFVHLEEAHRKLKNEVKSKEKEWQKEKNALLDGISTLQTDLESRVRISRDFECRLEMCNQALAHSEGKRKLLESQLTESRRNFDGVCAEYDEAKLNFENLSSKRDQEIANLRSSLGAKEFLYKEMENQFKILEQEKQDLLVSLKELQEAQIREASFSYSSSKIQKKLKAKESEWRAQEEKLTEELYSCKSDLKNREREVLKLELLTKAKNSEWQAQEEKLLEELNSCKLELKNIERYMLELELHTKAEKSEWRSREEKLSEELNSCKLELKNREREILEFKLLKMKESEWRDQEERLSEELNSCKLELKDRGREMHELKLLTKAEKSEWRSREERLSDELNSCKLELKIRERELLDLELLKTKESEWRDQKERLSEELNSCKLELKNRERELLELEFLKAKQSEWRAQEERLSKELNSFKLELKNREGEILQLELLKAKDSEWQAIEEQLSVELNSCKSELKNKEKVILELELLNQEASLTLLILKSELCCMNLVKREMQEDKMHKLVQQLEEKKALSDEREKVVILSALPEEMERLKGMLGVQSEEHAERVQSDNKKSEKLSEELNRCRSELRIRNESLNKLNRELEACYSQIVELELINQETSLTLMVFKSEFPCMNLKNKESLKCMFEDSEMRRVQSEENAVQMQSELRKIEVDLYEKLCETSEIEFELQVWKSTAEQLEVNLERSLTMRHEVEASLFAQMEVEMNLRKEREDLIHQLEEKEKGMDGLRQLSNAKTVQSGEEKEALAQLEADSDENTPEKAKRIYQLVEEKEQRIYDLQQQVAALEKEFESSTASFSSNLSRMQKERNLLSESWEKIKSDEILKEMEIQEKNTMIAELENDLRGLRELVDRQGRKIQETRAELEKKELEVRKLERELEIEVESSEKTIEKLKSENGKLGSAIHFLSDKMDALYTEEDVKLKGSLEKIVGAFDTPEAQSTDEHEDDDDAKENVSTFLSSSPLMKKVEGEIRSPLRAINN